MNPNQPSASPSTHPNLAVSSAEADLEAQIERIEQRLVAREAWLKATAESLAQRAQIAVKPKPWVLPAVGVGVAVWLGWRLLGRRSPARADPALQMAPPPAAHHDEGLAGLPLAGLTALGWPLVPPAWRERVSPAAAAAVVSALVALGRRLAQRRSQAPRVR